MLSFIISIDLVELNTQNFENSSIHKSQVQMVVKKR